MITKPQRTLLCALDRHEQLGTRQLAEIARAPRIAVYSSLEDLRAAGLVNRDDTHGPARVSLWSLTDAGREALR